MPYSNFYQPQMIPTQQVQQSNNFILVPNEDAARNYPVGPGVSVNFKNENAPYIYTKTMGFSQFDRPIFKRYKLIEDEVNPIVEEPTNANELDEIKSRIEQIEKDLKELKEGV